MVVDEQAFFRLRGILLLLLVIACSCRYAGGGRWLVARLVAAGAALGLYPRADPGGDHRRSALATTVRVVDRVHDDTADGRALALQRMRPALPQLMLLCSALPTSPTGRARRHVDAADLTDGMRRVAYGPSLPTSWIERRRCRPS